MVYPTRIYYTDADKALMWDRWRKGQSLNEIGRHFERSHTSIQNILSQTGGIRPPERKRSLRSLSLSDREEISRGIVVGRSIRSIAAEWRTRRWRGLWNRSSGSSGRPRRSPGRLLPVQTSTTERLSFAVAAASR